MIGLELRTRPIHGEFRDRVEVLRGHQAADRLVMISANGAGPEFPQSLRDLVGIGAVAYDVTQAHGEIPTVLGGAQDGVKRGDVRLQIAENENSHPYFPISGHEYK